MRIFLLCLVLLSGCGSELKDILGSGFQKPDVKFTRTDLSEFSLGGLTLNTVWTLNNPNPAGVKLAELAYKLWVDEKQVAAGSPPAGLEIPKSGSKEIVFPANVKFADLAGVIGTFLTKDRAPYRAEGQIGVETPLGIIRFPLNTSGDFEVPKVPSVEFSNPHIRQMSLSSVTIDFPMAIASKNSYPLPIGVISGALSIAGVEVGKLTTDTFGVVDQKPRKVTLPLKIGMEGATRAIVSALDGKPTKVSFNADVESEGVHVPLNVEQAVKFLR